MTTDTDHPIKVNRAMSLASIGAYPESARAMLRAIPHIVVAALTAKQLAALMDANWTLAQASKAIAERAVIEDGGVWDATRGRFEALA